MNWMKFRWLYFAISGLVIIPGIISLFIFRLRPAIDFVGGTLLELKFEKNIAVGDLPRIEEIIREKKVAVHAIQPSGQNTLLIRLGAVNRQEVIAIENNLGEKFGEIPQELRLETIGPILGRELLFKAVMAILAASLVILSYIAWQFRSWRFGICAILAMFHDSLVLLGSFSLLGLFFGVEVDALFVTAMLTILSFSVHDTVVVYDRIRESEKYFPEMNLETLANKAVTETLSRSLNNSLTIIFMLLALFLLGGETIKWFVVALLIGTISGTYSSTFTAVPLLVVWDYWKRKFKKS